MEIPIKQTTIADLIEEMIMNFVNKDFNRVAMNKEKIQEMLEKNQFVITETDWSAYDRKYILPNIK